MFIFICLFGGFPLWVSLRNPQKRYIKTKISGLICFQGAKYSSVLFATYIFLTYRRGFNRVAIARSSPWITFELKKRIHNRDILKTSNS